MDILTDSWNRTYVLNLEQIQLDLTINGLSQKWVYGGSLLNCLFSIWISCILYYHCIYYHHIINHWGTKSPKPLRPRHEQHLWTSFKVIHSYIQATFKHVNPTINTFIIKLKWIWTFEQVRSRPNINVQGDDVRWALYLHPAMCWQCQVRRKYCNCTFTTKEFGTIIKCPEIKEIFS